MTRGRDLPTSPRAQRKEATRAALVAAAHALAGRAEGDPLDPAAVAAQAGVSRPLFYAHFPSRADFVDALFASVHAPAAGAPAAPPPRGTGAVALRRCFEALAAPLDAHAPLARALIPASLAPGPVAAVRATRREAAVTKLAALLPAALPDRRRRAAFLMDAFHGLQLAWCRAPDGPSLVARVRRDLVFAIRGVLAASRPAASRSPRPSAP